MNETSKEFLNKLADLLEEYKISIEILESCSGYSGFSVDGLEFSIPYTKQDYGLFDFVFLSGRYHDAADIRKEIK